MAVFQASMFMGQRIVLDGNEFVNCVFDRCVLVYGGGPLKMIGNTLTNITWEFTDAAARTTALLSSLYRGGDANRRFVEYLLANYGSRTPRPPLQPGSAGAVPGSGAPGRGSPGGNAPTTEGES